MSEPGPDGTLTRLCPPSDNSATVSRYTDSMEEQHAYIKETVETVFPSNIRILQAGARTHWVHALAGR